jgi:hypothetical protein
VAPFAQWMLTALPLLGISKGLERLPLAGARKRQGEACTQVLAPLLESQDNLGDLAVLGEWIVLCDTYRVGR